MCHQAVETELDAENKGDMEMRGQYGSQWRRPQSKELTEEIMKSIDHHYKNLKAAAENDRKLGKMLSGKRKEMTRVLSLPPNKVESLSLSSIFSLSLSLSLSLSHTHTHTQARTRCLGGEV